MFQASKELPDEDQKPVAKPKEKSPKAEKKKEKKHKKKKKKKTKGGDLGKIDEDVEGKEGESDVKTDPPSSSAVEESSESKIESSTKEVRFCFCYYVHNVVLYACFNLSLVCTCPLISIGLHSIKELDFKLCSQKRGNNPARS